MTDAVEGYVPEVLYNELLAQSIKQQELLADLQEQLHTVTKGHDGGYVTRFEYIGPKGREMTLYGNFTLSAQDHGKTLKVFGDQVAKINSFIE